MKGFRHRHKPPTQIQAVETRNSFSKNCRLMSWLYEMLVILYILNIKLTKVEDQKGFNRFVRGLFMNIKILR